MRDEYTLIDVVAVSPDKRVEGRSLRRWFGETQVREFCGDGQGRPSSDELRVAKVWLGRALMACLEVTQACLVAVSSDARDIAQLDGALYAAMQGLWGARTLGELRRATTAPLYLAMTEKINVPAPLHEVVVNICLALDRQILAHSGLLEE